VHAAADKEVAPARWWMQQEGLGVETLARAGNLEMGEKWGSIPSMDAITQLEWWWWATTGGVGSRGSDEMSSFHHENT